MLIIGDDCDALSQLFTKEQGSHHFDRVYQIIHVDKQSSLQAISSIYHNIVTLSLDLSNPTALNALIQYIEKIQHHIHLCVFTPSFSNKTESLEGVIRQQHLQWEKTGLSTVLLSQSMIQHMLHISNGSLIFLAAEGAEGKHDDLLSQSLFAGIRALSQSLAREFQPKGIHITYSKLSKWDNADNQLLQSVKDLCLHIHKQPKSTWSQELNTA